jgi:biotin transport system substrate-specific component
MSKLLTHAPSTTQEHWLETLRDVALVVGASLFVALCARVTIPLLPLTPVPLTMQNLGVLLVGLLLGSRRGFAALVLYLIEGMLGFSVFNPIGPGGVTQLFGITGGFLLAYPFVAFAAGYLFEHSKKTFLRAFVAGCVAEFLLFLAGLSWLYVFTHSFKAAYVFLPAEVLKIMLAAAIAVRWRRVAHQGV